MVARSNALSELTRFWLQARHGCLVDEAIPVKVPYAHSDIGLVVVRPDFQAWLLPDGTQVIRAIVETKDEHDFDPEGRDFGKRLRADVIIGTFICGQYQMRVIQNFTAVCPSSSPETRGAIPPGRAPRLIPRSTFRTRRSCDASDRGSWCSRRIAPGAPRSGRARQRTARPRDNR